MEQLSIFDIEKNNVFNSMLEQLDKYGIDEYFRKNYKGNHDTGSYPLYCLEMLDKSIF